MDTRMPPFYFYSLIVLEVVSHFTVPIYTFNINPFNYLGVLVILFGLRLNLFSKMRVLNHNTTIIPFEKSNKLVIDGAFRFSRNPMYLGMLLILIGEAAIFLSMSAFLIAILFIPLMNLKFIYTEEKLLEQTFKNEYLQYKEKVRRWI